MSSYEKALKLKNAGFPQKNNPVNFKNSWIEEDGNLMTEGEMVYFPTLSELIEQCIKINPIGFSIKRNASGTWVCSTDLAQPVGGSGSTPEEAVANLWLALNKK